MYGILPVFKMPLSFFLCSILSFLCDIDGDNVDDIDDDLQDYTDC